MVIHKININMKIRKYPKEYPISIKNKELEFIKEYMISECGYLKAASVKAIPINIINEIKECALQRGLLDIENLSECIFWIINNLKRYPKKCKCGKNVTHFHSFSKGYPHKFCSSICSNGDLNVQNKKKDASFKRFGTEYPWQHNDIKNKMKELNLAKYGVESNMQDETVFNKTCELNLD